MYLYHYYDKKVGPFQNLSDLPEKEADELLEKIRCEKPGSMAAKRQPEYMHLRRYYEEILRTEFEKKGGSIKRKVPHYMVVEECPWLASWFEDPAYLKIPIEEFDLNTVSFTYGDSHPTFSDRVTDGREYRKKLYTYEEILMVIQKYGYPQDWNSDGAFGPERYIEVHIWSDDVIKKAVARLNGDINL